MSTETGAADHCGAEFLGTLVLVFFAVGAAVLAGEYIGTLGIALAFGFTLLALAYAHRPDLGLPRQPGGHPGHAAGQAPDHPADGHRVLGRAGRRRHRRRGAALPGRQAGTRACRRAGPSAPTASATARRSASTSAVPSSPSC